MKKVINYKAQKEDWDKAKEKAFKKLNAKANIDGFRPGKAPRNVFEKKYPGQITMEAADELIDQEYRRILLEDKIQPILEPKIDLVKVNDKELEVNFTFILEPEVKLGEYKNLNVKKETVKVTDEEIQERIHSLLNSYAELVVKENNTVENGDLAIIDFEGFKDDVAFDGGKGENYSLEIGSHTFIPGFEEGIIGMKVGESKDLKLTFPEDYMQKDLAGSEVIFKVTVNEIKTRVLPELDEEFFQDLGMDDIHNKEELEKTIKKELTAQKEEEAEQDYLNKLLEKAVANMEVEVDEEIIEAETEEMYKNYMDHMATHGISEEVYLEYAQTTKEDIIEKMKESASVRIHNTYLLNAIIEKEQINVTEEEVKAEIAKIAKKHNITEKEAEESLGETAKIMYDLKIQKAIDLMKSE